MKHHFSFTCSMALRQWDAIHYTLICHIKIASAVTAVFNFNDIARKKVSKQHTAKCQGTSLNKLELNNEWEIREQTASAPSTWRNRSMVPRSGFWQKLVFEDERYQTPSSGVGLLIDNRSARLREDQQPGNVKSVTENQFKSSGPDFIKTTERWGGFFFPFY